jgi:hypothetical protein
MSDNLFITITGRMVNWSKPRPSADGITWEQSFMMERPGIDGHPPKRWQFVLYTRNEDDRRFIRSQHYGEERTAYLKVNCRNRLVEDELRVYYGFNLYEWR